jgi:hypothetical protein
MFHATVPARQLRDTRSAASSASLDSSQILSRCFTQDLRTRAVPDPETS